MSFTQIHSHVLGFGLIGGWLLVCFWALALRLLGRGEARWFWRFVSLTQILLVVQALVGVVLLLMGRLPGPGTPFIVTFHLLYGFVFPVTVLVFAHKWAREERWHPFTIFAGGAFVIVALLVRGWTQVGVLTG